MNVDECPECGGQLNMTAVHNNCWTAECADCACRWELSDTLTTITGRVGVL